MKKSVGTRRRRTPRIDRLNQLPDALLIHILSFLTTKEAAVTSLLSKRWRFLWTELPSLQLWEPENQNEDTEYMHLFIALSRTRRFMAWVDRIFAVRTAASVDKLSVRIQYHHTFDPQIDEWIRYAVSKRVKAMTLIIESRHPQRTYTLPDCIYSIPSLERLLVHGSISMSTEAKVNWGCLKDLCLQGVGLDQDMVDDILAGCPVLGRFELYSCSGFTELKLQSENLHTLAIVDDESPDPLQISAPHLRYLDVWFTPSKRLLVFLNFGTLDKFRAEYYWKGFYPDQAIVKFTAQLLIDIQDVKELLLRPRFFKVIAMLASMDWEFPQSKRSRIEISTLAGDMYNFYGIIALLESSPKVETLVIEFSDYPVFYSTLEQPITKDNLDCDLRHLKNVYFKNFCTLNGGKQMLTFVRILLKSALALERMEFAIEDVVSKDIFSKICKNLLCLPEVMAVYPESRQYQSIRYKATVIFSSAI